MRTAPLVAWALAIVTAGAAAVLAIKIHDIAADLAALRASADATSRRFDDTDKRLDALAAKVDGVDRRLAPTNSTPP